VVAFREQSDQSAIYVDALELVKTLQGKGVTHKFHEFYTAVKQPTTGSPQTIPVVVTPKELVVKAPPQVPPKAVVVTAPLEIAGGDAPAQDHVPRPAFALPPVPEHTEACWPPPPAAVAEAVTAPPKPAGNDAPEPEHAPSPPTSEPEHAPEHTPQPPPLPGHAGNDAPVEAPAPMLALEDSVVTFRERGDQSAVDMDAQELVKTLRGTASHEFVTAVQPTTGRPQTIRGASRWARGCEESALAAEPAQEQEPAAFTPSARVTSAPNKINRNW